MDRRIGVFDATPDLVWIRPDSYGLISVLYAVIAHCCSNCRDNCIFTCLLCFCICQVSTINKKDWFICVFHLFIDVMSLNGNWISYPVFFGWPPGCCLSCRACRVLSYRFEWSIFPRADAGTSYRMSLLHTLSWERFPAPQRPRWKQLQTFMKFPYMTRET